MTGQKQYTTKLLEYVKNGWGKEAPSEVVAKIGQGDRLTTEALGISQNAKYRSQVVQVGAVDRLLEFLIKTDKPFGQVLPAGGDLPCPSIWLNVLNNFCVDGFLQPQSLARDVQYKIIINLGPLFQDMSNMKSRQLFGSEDIWIKSLMFFVNILYSLLSSNFDRISDFLLKQKLLKSFLVEILFLEMGHPDVAKAIKTFSKERDDRMPPPSIVGLSQTFAACSIKLILTKRGIKNPTLIEDFAGTPIGPEHELFLMTGILELLTTSSDPGWYQGGYAATLSIFLILFDKAERLSGPFGVDSASEVIVPVCRKYLQRSAPFNRDRFFVENLLTSIVCVGGTLMTPSMGGRQAPIDYNVAKAIRAGLFDFLLECCDANDPRMATALEGLVRTLSATVILDETQKAMQDLAPSILAKAERVLERHPVLIPPLQNIQRIFKNPMLRISTVEDETCAFCQEKAKKETMQKCPFCKTIVYCSKDCQRLNWMIHQSDCASKRKEPVAQTPDQLLNDGKKMFSKHITKMLLQASLKGQSILESVVVVDMCEITPLLKVYTLEQFAEAYIQDEDAITLSQKIIARNKKQGALTVSFVGFSETEGFNGNLMTFPADTAPRTPNVLKVDNTAKWMVAQKEITQSSLGESAVAQMKKEPRIFRATLLKTMKP